MRLVMGLAAMILATAAPAEEAAHDYPEASPYVEMPEVAAAAQLMGARTAAIVQGKRLLAVFGANWCHDSRALAGWLAQPRLAALTAERFVVLYIDAGKPQDNEGRNLALAAAYGVSDIEGTPNLLVIDPASGKLFNTAEAAKSWRNAASRSEGEIYTELLGLSGRTD